VVSVTDPYGRILRFLDRSRYFFFQAAPQLYSTRLSGPRSRLIFFSGSAGNRTRASESVAKNSDPKCLLIKCGTFQPGNAVKHIFTNFVVTR
jgi:hypothetical protein